MMIATLVTFLTPNLTNIALIAIAIVIGGGFGYLAAKRVAMTDMPQMIALYNGMGGGAAAGISAVALLGTTSATTGSLAVVGGLIGAVAVVVHGPHTAARRVGAGGAVHVGVAAVGA